MFNSVVLDVVIGLVFIYLLYSLLATTVQEIISSWFSFRAKILERAIIRMLEDENNYSLRIRSIFDLFTNSGSGGKKSSFSEIFYRHPLIKFLGENKRNSKPAYIDKQTFSKVIIDLLRGEDVVPGQDIRELIQNALETKKTNWGTAKIEDETRSFLKSIWADSQGDIQKFREHLENWFDATMERATGWYKKNTQVILLIIGFAIAVIFNVDTLKIVSKLEKDPKLREQLVQQADSYLKANPDLDKKIAQSQAALAKSRQVNKAQNNPADSNSVTDSSAAAKKPGTTQLDEDSINLAKYEKLKSDIDSLVNQANALVKTDIKKANDVIALGWGTPICKSCDFACYFRSLLGWLITALALSLGAPFWYDLLNKLMKLRGSVSGSASDGKQNPQSTQSGKINKVG